MLFWGGYDNKLKTTYGRIIIIRYFHRLLQIHTQVFTSYKEPKKVLPYTLYTTYVNERT